MSEPSSTDILTCTKAVTESQLKRMLIPDSLGLEYRNRVDSIYHELPYKPYVAGTPVAIIFDHSSARPCVKIIGTNRKGLLQAGLRLSVGLTPSTDSLDVKGYVKLGRPYKNRQNNIGVNIYKLSADAPVPPLEFSFWNIETKWHWIVEPYLMEREFLKPSDYKVASINDPWITVLLTSVIEQFSATQISTGHPGTDDLLTSIIFKSKIHDFLMNGATKFFGNRPNAADIWTIYSKWDEWDSRNLNDKQRINEMPTSTMDHKKFKKLAAETGHAPKAPNH